MQKETYTAATSLTPCLPGLEKKKIQVIVEKEVTDICDWLHAKVGALEWSGVIFYTHEGDIDDLDKMIIRVHHFYPMDIGNAGATEFSFDEVFTKAYTVFPNAIRMNMGLMHTHHSMGLFFSQTDENELISNSKLYNYYLSIITNFTRKFIGKIGLVVSPESPNWTAVNSKGETVKLNLESQPRVYHIPCDVEPEEAKIEIADWVVETYKELNKKPTYAYERYAGYGGSFAGRNHPPTIPPTKEVVKNDKEPKRLSSIADLFPDDVEKEIERRREEAKKKIEEFEKQNSPGGQKKDAGETDETDDFLSFEFDPFELLVMEVCVFLECANDTPGEDFSNLISSEELLPFSREDLISSITNNQPSIKEQLKVAKDLWVLIMDKLKVEQMESFIESVGAIILIAIEQRLEMIDEDESLVKEGQSVDTFTSMELTFKAMKAFIKDIEDKNVQTFLYSLTRELQKESIL